MSRETADDLRAIRSLISEPRSWCINTNTIDLGNGKYAYCLAGAILKQRRVFSRIWWRATAPQALHRCLRRRYDLDQLPVPIYGAGGSKPVPWAVLFRGSDVPAVITQFNNSSTQADVLGLLDEAIADEDPPRRVEEPPAQPVAEPAEPDDEEGDGPVPEEPTEEENDRARHRELELA